MACDLHTFRFMTMFASQLTMGKVHGWGPKMQGQIQLPSHPRPLLLGMALGLYRRMVTIQKCKARLGYRLAGWRYFGNTSTLGHLRSSLLSLLSFLSYEFSLDGLYLIFLDCLLLFFFGLCVYLCSLLPCTFDGWVLILDFYVHGFLLKDNFNDSLVLQIQLKNWIPHRSASISCTQYKKFGKKIPCF